MKTGITFDLFNNEYPRFGDEKYQKIKSHGYDCIDFNLMDTDKEFYGENFESAIKREKKAIESAGLEVVQTHGPWRWPPRDNTKDERAERLDKFKKAVLSTAIFGSKYMVAHPIMPYGMEDVGQGVEKSTFSLNVDFWGELARFGESQGVTVCVENMPMPKFSLATPCSLLQLIDEIDSKYLGFCLDTGHVNVIKGLDVGEEIEKIGKHLKTLHVHDNDGERDIHLYPFAGTINWKSFTNALKKIGFDGVMNLETHLKSDLVGDEFEEECLCLANIAKTLASLSSGE